MRRPYTVLCILLLPVLLEGRSRVQGWCEVGNKTITVQGIPSESSTPVQRSYPNCTVTVYLAGTTTLASIYADDSGTTKANPFTADSSGYWFFYADNRKYDVRLSGGGIPTPFTLGDHRPFDQSVFWIDATSYGVICDGSTDDSASLTSALAAATSAQGVVVLPAGRICKLASTVTIPSNMEIRGGGLPDRWRGGSSPTIIAYAATGNSAFRVKPNSGAGASNIRLTNLLIDGSGSSGADGIQLDASNSGATYIENVRMSNISVRNFRYGLSTTGTVFDVLLDYFNCVSTASDCIRIDTSSAGAGSPSQWTIQNPFLVVSADSAWGVNVVGTGSVSDLKVIGGTVADGSAAGANGINGVGGLYIIGTSIEGLSKAGTVGVRYRGSNGFYYSGFSFAWGIGLQIGDPNNASGQAISTTINGLVANNITNDIIIESGGSRLNTKILNTGPVSSTILNKRETIDGDYGDVIFFNKNQLLDMRGTALESRNGIKGGTVTVQHPASPSVLTVQASASQGTTNLVDIKDSSGSVLSRILSDGSAVFPQIDVGTYQDVEKVNIDGNLFTKGTSGSGVRMQYGAGSSFWVNACATNLLCLGGTGSSPPASGAATLEIKDLGYVRYRGVVFSGLTAEPNGTMVYCSDCTIANPCAGGGTGAFAKRLNSVWVCN